MAWRWLTFRRKQQQEPTSTVEFSLNSPESLDQQLFQLLKTPPAQLSKTDRTNNPLHRIIKAKCYYFDPKGQDSHKMAIDPTSCKNLRTQICEFENSDCGDKQNCPHGFPRTMDDDGLCHRNLCQRYPSGDWRTLCSHISKHGQYLFNNIVTHCTTCPLINDVETLTKYQTPDELVPEKMLVQQHLLAELKRIERITIGPKSDFHRFLSEVTRHQDRVRVIHSHFLKRQTNGSPFEFTQELLTRSQALVDKFTAIFENLKLKEAKMKAAFERSQAQVLDVCSYLQDLAYDEELRLHENALIDIEERAMQEIASALSKIVHGLLDLQRKFNPTAVLETLPTSTDLSLQQLEDFANSIDRSLTIDSEQDQILQLQ